MIVLNEVCVMPITHIFIQKEREVVVRREILRRPSVVKIVIHNFAFLRVLNNNDISLYIVCVVYEHYTPCLLCLHCKKK